MPSSLRLAEWTREEVAEIAPYATVVLPTAATEQHGPHLPLLTDCALGEAVATGAAERAAREIPVVVAPVLPFGNSHHHLFACALSLSSSVYLAVLRDLTDCLVRSGFRRVFILNSHGGNDECVKLLAKDAVLQHDLSIAACSYWDVARDAVLAAGGIERGVFPGHAGRFETGMMQAVAARLVRQDRLPKDGPSPVHVSSRGIVPGLSVQKSGEWTRIRGFSDASDGVSAQQGALWLEAITAAVANAMVRFHRELA